MCREGQYTEQTATTLCKKCLIGSFLEEIDTDPLDHDEKSDCKPCRLGEFQGNDGSSACNICTEGQFTEVTGSTSCKKCIAGTSLIDNGETLESHDEIKDCTPCRPGEFGDIDGSIACKICTEGQFTEESGCIHKT